MTNEMHSSLEIAQGLSVVVPEKEEAYPIPRSDWDYLKDKVNRIAMPSSFYNTMGAVLIGIAGSALVAGITLRGNLAEDKDFVLYACWSIFAVTLICGAFAICVHYLTQKKSSTISKDDVVEEMDRLEKRYSYLKGGEGPGEGGLDEDIDKMQGIMRRGT